MSNCIRLAFFLMMWVISSDATWGHGTPIRLGVEESKLFASNGFTDSHGLADMYFADPLEDSAFIAAPGDRLITDFPGLEMNDLEPDSGLSQRIVPVPVSKSSGPTQRLYWFWDQLSEDVRVLETDPALTLFSQRGYGAASFHQWGEPPAPLRIAEPLSSDMGEHRHVLYYILENSPLAPIGAYGFFTTFAAPGLGETPLVLVALNNGLGAEQFQQAARAINRAALLPGDATRDFRVDLKDFAALRSNFGKTDAAWSQGDFNVNNVVDLTDFGILRENFGRSRISIVAEPTSAFSAGIGLGLIAWWTWSRKFPRRGPHC